MCWTTGWYGDIRPHLHFDFYSSYHHFPFNCFGSYNPSWYVSSTFLPVIQGTIFPTFSLFVTLSCLLPKIETFNLWKIWHLLGGDDRVLIDVPVFNLKKMFASMNKGLLLNRSNEIQSRYAGLFWRYFRFLREFHPKMDLIGYCPPLLSKIWCHLFFGA